MISWDIFFALISYTITGLGIVFVCFLNFFFWSGRVQEDMVLLGFRLFISRYVGWVGGWVGIYFYFSLKMAWREMMGGG